MAYQIRPLIAGNWKMNGNVRSFADVETIKTRLAAKNANADVVICPPATLLHRISTLLQGSGAATGAQNCHKDAKGAHTGDISAAMIKDAGASFVIVGHSERRGGYGETSDDVALKASAALAHGIVPIICCGESLDARASGQATGVVLEQVNASCPQISADQKLVVAYEPVWAIGTGNTARPSDIAEMHAAIRAALVERFGTYGHSIHILYGGSVTSDNAAGILAIEHVNGALVGGASLRADDFADIIFAA